MGQPPNHQPNPTNLGGKLMNYWHIHGTSGLQCAHQRGLHLSWMFKGNLKLQKLHPPAPEKAKKKPRARLAMAGAASFQALPGKRAARVSQETFDSPPTWGEEGRGHRVNGVTGKDGQTKFNELESHLSQHTIPWKN